MVYIQVFLPLVLAGLAMLIPSNRFRPWLVPLAASVHAVLTLTVLIRPEWGSSNPWLVLDPVGKIILLNINILYFL